MWGFKSLWRLYFISLEEWMKEDYASKMDSYICQYDGILGLDLTHLMRKTLEGERPLTLEDSDRWVYSIDRHIEAILKKEREKTI